MTERPLPSPDLLPPRHGDTLPGSLPARSVVNVATSVRAADDADAVPAGSGSTASGLPGPGAGRRLAASFAATVAVLGFAGWALLSVQGAAAAVRIDLARVVWLLPALVALHLGQLLLSAVAWRGLLTPRLPQGTRPPAAVRFALPSLALFWRLRIVREGIDSLLPVAQVGGEIVGAQLLRRLGMAAPLAGASIVVDVTLELLAQVLFLAAGLLALAALPSGVTPGSGPAGGASAAWLLPVLGGLAALLVLAQRFGALRGLELLTGAVARHVPGLGDLAGLQAEAEAIYRRGPALWRAAGLHGLAWLLGTAETWALLHALGHDASPQQALVVESLGMAARSAGFALPGAIGMQEGGFVLGVAVAGLSGAATMSAGATVGLALSLAKRLREISTGAAGLALWRWHWPAALPGEDDDNPLQNVS